VAVGLCGGCDRETAKSKSKTAAETKQQETELQEREAKLREDLVHSLSGADSEKEQLANRLSQIMVEKEQVSASCTT